MRKEITRGPMSKQITTIALGTAMFAANLAAVAQTATPAPVQRAEAAPAAPDFEGYRPFSAEEVGDWRKANDTVREIGGWRAYAREIQGGSQGSAQPGGAHGPSRAPAPPADPHQGHHQ
jgi:hypothetical protein